MQFDNVVKGWVTLIVGVLSGLLLFLGSIGVTYEWFTVESIGAFSVFLTAALLLIFNLYAVWKNTYVTKKGKKELEVLERNDLK